ncbi:MAG: ABC transporter ATP-binding protein/permease [Oscillospiraceae bacterium]|jgi:ATP-binding cassette subfamily B protein|nr:ABC transporter ATP-binding protein/permease [Oscillospiraceae bacterium]
MISSELNDGVARYSTWHLARWISKYFRPYKKLLFLDLFFSSVFAGCALIFPKLFEYLTSKKVMFGDGRGLMLCLGAFLLNAILESTAVYNSSIFGHKMGFYVETDMRRDLFCHIQKLPFPFFDNNKIGQLISRITSDLKDLGDIVHHCIIDLWIFAVKVVGSFTILLFMNVQLTFIVFSIMPILFGFGLYFNKRFYKVMLTARQKLGEINAKTEDSLLGIRVVKAFSNERKECDKFEKSSKTYLNSRLTLNVNVSRFVGGITLLEGIAYIVAGAFGSWFVIHGKIDMPELIAYIFFVDLLVNAMITLKETLEHLQEGITSVSRVRSIMEEPTEVNPNEKTVELSEVKGDIRFESVHFKHKNANKNILDGIDLHIKAGEKIAIVGASGMGKSTFCSLIPRFYDVNKGRILIDGVDTRTVNLKSLRENIGMIQQDVYLFSGTIAENIAYAKISASVDEIIQAAKDAGADEFITQMANGYETQVGERGTRLSGGQRQRISIARAFLKNAPILILDEATSALDNENEVIIQHSLEKLCKGKTTITVAQRLSTIANSDKILVLDHGKIVEAGTHKELLAHGGVYHQLCGTDNAN